MQKTKVDESTKISEQLKEQIETTVKKFGITDWQMSGRIKIGEKDYGFFSSSMGWIEVKNYLEGLLDYARSQIERTNSMN